jgi:hypothetical protein
VGGIVHKLKRNKFFFILDIIFLKSITNEFGILLKLIVLFVKIMIFLSMWCEEKNVWEDLTEVFSLVRLGNENFITRITTLKVTLDKIEKHKKNML